MRGAKTFGIFHCCLVSVKKDLKGLQHVDLASGLGKCKLFSPPSLDFWKSDPSLKAQLKGGWFSVLSQYSSVPRLGDGSGWQSLKPGEDGFQEKGVGPKSVCQRPSLFLWKAQNRSATETVEELKQQIGLLYSLRMVVPVLADVKGPSENVSMSCKIGDGAILLPSPDLWVFSGYPGPDSKDFSCDMNRLTESP
ncbi:hypothetical protein STEG23_012018, partial [Scotinomys teguina]